MGAGVSLEQVLAIDLGIALRGRKTGMGEQFLDGAEIRAGAGTQFEPRCVEAFGELDAEEDVLVLSGGRRTPSFATG